MRKTLYLHPEFTALQQLSQRTTGGTLWTISGLHPTLTHAGCLTYYVY